MLSAMLVSIRKRSWEEHVTPASRSQYSYDDLDLVCCPGVDVGGSWLGADSPKPGQRTRCASMPEGCPQLPEELSQTPKVPATVPNQESKVLKLLQNSVSTGLEEEEEEEEAHSPHDLLDADIPQGGSGSELLQSGGPPWNHSGLCVPKVACETVRMRRSSGGDEIPTEKQNISQHDPVFECSRVSDGEQQGLSVPSNNERLPAGREQPGRRPAQEGTMEQHPDGHRRPPGALDISLNQPSAAGRQAPDGLPEAQGEKTSTSDADAGLIPALGEQAENRMEEGDESTQARTEPTRTGDQDTHFQNRCSDSSRNPNGFNPEPQPEKGGFEGHEQNEEEGKQRCHGYKMKQNEERAELRFAVEASSDDGSNKKVDTGCFRGAQEIYLETETSARDEEGGRSVLKASACHQNQIVAPQFENSSSKLDPIPEVSHSGLHDAPVHARQDSSFTPNPDVPQSRVDNHHITPEKTSPNLLLRSAEDRQELQPQRRHRNQEASLCDASKSPDSEVVDGARAYQEGDLVKARTKKVSLFSSQNNSDGDCTPLWCSADNWRIWDIFASLF